MLEDYQYDFDFAITTHCQAKCRSCPRTNKLTGEVQSWLQVEHMAVETFEKAINSSHIVNKFGGKLTLCGEYGDPMMHPKIDSFLDIGTKKFKWVSINTNGGLRQPLWYSKAAKTYQNLAIDFAIDGIDHDTNWKYREGVDWQRAMDNMKSFRDNGGRTHWHFLIFEWNWHQLDSVEQMSKELDIPVMYKINRREFGRVDEKHLPQIMEFLESI